MPIGVGGAYKKNKQLSLREIKDENLGEIGLKL